MAPLQKLAYHKGRCQPPKQPWENGAQGALRQRLHAPVKNIPRAQQKQSEKDGEKYNKCQMLHIKRFLEIRNAKVANKWKGHKVLSASGGIFSVNDSSGHWKKIKPNNHPKERWFLHKNSFNYFASLFIFVRKNSNCYCHNRNIFIFIAIQELNL
jgi:hypothetical protein